MFFCIMYILRKNFLSFFTLVEKDTSLGVIKETLKSKHRQFIELFMVSEEL